MGTSWEPRKINHTELKSRRAGIVGPFMVFVLVLGLLLGIAIAIYAFHGVRFDGDLIQIFAAWGTVAARLGNLSDFFTLEHMTTFLGSAVVPTIVALFCLYMIYLYRKTLGGD